MKQYNNEMARNRVITLRYVNAMVNAILSIAYFLCVCREIWLDMYICNSEAVEHVEAEQNLFIIRDWEGKGPCAIVPLTCKMAHQSFCRMIIKWPIENFKSIEKSWKWPIGKHLFPITKFINMQTFTNVSNDFHFNLQTNVCPCWLLLPSSMALFSNVRLIAGPTSACFFTRRLWLFIMLNDSFKELSHFKLLCHCECSGMSYYYPMLYLNQY